MRISGWIVSGMVAGLVWAAGPAWAGERYAPSAGRNALADRNDDDEAVEEASRPYTIDAEYRAVSRLQGLYGEPGAFARARASKIHDRVTIVINDSLSASSTMKTDFSRDASSDWGLDDFFTLRMQGGDLLAVPRGKEAAAAAGQTAKTPRFRFDATREHGADGKNNITSNLRTEISGSVLDVLPNGHLIVQARKTQVVNRETQSVIFSGRVDPRDLDANNRVQDRDVIDREVRIEGKGVFNDLNRRGRIAAFVDWVNPF